MLLEEACRNAGIPNEIKDGGFGVCDIGETLTLPVKGGMPNGSEVQPEVTES